MQNRRVRTVDIHCHCEVPEVWDRSEKEAILGGNAAELLQLDSTSSTTEG